MPDGKALATYLLSAAALLGPLAYILFAFYEMGRLSFFGAPIEFLQISSFGILPVVLTVYPAMFVTFLIVALLSGVQFATPRRQIVLVAVAFTYVSMVFFSLSMTPLWRWIFGLSTALGIGVALIIKAHTPDFGNEVERVQADPQHASTRHFFAITRYIFVLSGAAVFLLCFSAAGKKDAATTEYYWVTGSNVVIGFYGDHVLLGERRGLEVGPKFRVAELKSLEGSLTQLQVGPLKPASMWKAPGPGG